MDAQPTRSEVGSLRGEGVTEVAQLLTTARAAHARYRHAAGRIGKDGKVASPADHQATTAAITAALNARAEADERDPGHSDPAWSVDAEATRTTHQALMDFYLRYMGVRADG